MQTTFANRAAALLIAAAGAVHLALVPEYLGEKPYVGALFAAGGLACAWVALRLWSRHDAVAFTLGAAVAGGMAVGFVLSRTVGLPDFHPHDWELPGVLSLLLEAGFIGAWLVAVPPRLLSST